MALLYTLAAGALFVVLVVLFVVGMVKYGADDKEDYTCDGNCKRCWPSITCIHLLAGIILWMAGVYCVLPIHRMRSFICLAIACALLRLILVSANLATYFCPAFHLFWLRFALALLTTVLPVLDILYLCIGAPKAIVYDFFYGEFEDMAEEIAEILRTRYITKILGEKELLVYASSTVNISIREKAVYFETDCIQRREPYCVYDAPAEIANRIIWILENKLH